MSPQSLGIFRILLLHGTLMISQFPPTSGGVTNKIDKELMKKIGPAPAGSTWDVIVEFKKYPKLEVDLRASISSVRDPYEKTYEGMVLMKKYMNEIQGKVLEGIKKFQKTHKKISILPFFLTGDLGILKAPKELINQLGDDDEKPENANITRIVEDEVFNSEPPAIITESGDSVDLTRQIETKADKKGFKEAYALEMINAPAWWDNGEFLRSYKGYNGTGVIVGHMDTGVDVRHPSLKWNWVGKPYGWKDPLPEAVNNTFPYENEPGPSHGTHSLGLMVGRGRVPSDKKDTDEGFFGVGVAPGARWISCLACRYGNGTCTTIMQNDCGNFLYCPDPRNRCLHRPNVVSFSLVCDQNTTKRCGTGRDAMVQRLTQHGVIVVYGSGNNGQQGCQTVGNPADLEDVITVGSVDHQSHLSYFSGVGPPNHRYSPEYQKKNNIFKPDILAPGEKIISTVYTGRSAKFEYDYRTGTSASAPYVAGAIALLLSRTANMTLEKVKEILFNYTVLVTKLNLKPNQPNDECGNLANGVSPNHKFGWGRLRLPDPKDGRLPQPDEPKRFIPPPSDYPDLEDNSTPPSVRPGIVGVVMMALVAFQTTHYGMP